MGFTAQITAGASATISNTTGNYTGSYTATSLSLSSGTTAGKADRAVSLTGTIADSVTPAALNLSDGSLLGIDGQPAAFVEIVAIRIVNLSTDQEITAGGGTNAPAWAAFPPIGPGGEMLLRRSDDPAYPVVASTGDVFRLAAGGGTGVGYYIEMIGRSA